VVGLVIVSHSAALADGVVELAREMGGGDVHVEAAGGLDDGSVGTDAARVQAAIERAMSADGVLVLMDLGSALMSAEMATELLGDADRVLLSEAPLVEGAVAAAAVARGGASLEQVAAEARGALAMKASQLGTEEPAPGDAPAAAPADAEVRLPVVNEIGLHARPAALVVELASRFDADLRLRKAGRSGEVSARSLTGLMTLGARLGDELVAAASGPQAAEALTALETLAREGFGEGVAAGHAAGEAVAAPAAVPPAPEAAESAAPEAAESAAPEAAVPAAPEAAEPPAAGAVLTGIAASAGVAVALARHLEAGPEAPPEREAEGVEAESERLDRGRAEARAAIEHDRESLVARGAEAEAAIFSAHLALLDDEALLGPARAAIEGGVPAERAWLTAAEDAASTYRTLEEPLLRERAADVEDVGRRVVAAIIGDGRPAGLSEEGIVVAGELTPADAAGLDSALVRGIATARGTPTAHAAILARALGIPAVVGLGEEVLAVPAETMILLDGDEGSVHVAPAEERVRSAQRRAERSAARQAAAVEHAREPAVTRDGTRIEVVANLDEPGDAATAVELGAEGVGLLRTEFLFLEQPTLPTEEEQAKRLAEIADALDGRPLIVRTLDVGADKPLPALPMEPEDNPFLGLRGIRLSLARPELLATQLRAILRTAVEHPLKVMFPMVATVTELGAALEVMQDARRQTGIDAPLETGIMVEVPAAALASERLGRHVDFFSIGTNDLTQYTMAAERGNERVAGLLAGPHPSVLRLVRETVEGADAHGRWVGVCGELAGDPPAALLLAGLGVRELSMAPRLVPETKAALRSVTLADAREAAQRALEAEHADEARRLAEALL
jgi:phosphoenolpyruvate-protein phosphotransferase/dihydroxyacetone kinase phosphotransfer subunit